MDSVIETERTRLTLLTEGDFDDMLVMLLDPQNSHYIKHLHRKEEHEYRSVLQKRLVQIREKTGFHWVGRLKSNQELVGAVNLSLIPGTSRMQLGFQLHQKFWGKGYATEIASGVLSKVHENKNITKIYGVFEVNNLSSKKVLEKLGFEPETEDTLAEENVVTYRFLIPKSDVSA